MKVSQFIKTLQELDPNDECQICVGNQPVSAIDRMPYYYDGRMEKVERDHRNIPIKVGYPNHGSKIKIYFDTIEDALLDNPDAELDLSGITHQGKVERGYMEDIEAWKKQGHEFQEWKKNHAIAYESGKKYEPRISWRTRLTHLLKRLGVIDA